MVYVNSTGKDQTAFRSSLVRTSSDKHFDFHITWQVLELIIYISVESTAMVMSGWSVHLFSWASLTKGKLDQYFMRILSLVTLESAEGRRMAVEIIS